MDRYTHVVHDGFIKELGLKLDLNGNLAVDADYQTCEPGMFAAGDASTGASLIVRAIDAGRKAAASIDRWVRQG